MHASRVAGLSRRHPEPARIWVRYLPRRWPAAEGLWIDWSRGEPGAAARKEGEMPGSLPAVDDVLYLPPSRRGRDGERRELAAACAAAGSPVLLQVMPGDVVPDAPTLVAVWDLSRALLGGDLEALRSLPVGAGAVWPLVPGLTDGGSVLEEGLAALARAGARAVQGMRLELSPRARRMLAAGGNEALFERLFHGPPPSERAFSYRASAAGLEPFVPRPLPAEPPRLVTRRRVAAELRLAAELWHRLGRPEAQGHALLRAARWVDDEDVDLEALVFEDNLAIAEPLDALARRTIEEHLEAGGSRLLAELRSEYLEGQE